MIALLRSSRPPGLLGPFPPFQVPRQDLRLPARFGQRVLVAEFQGQLLELFQLSGPAFELPPLPQDFCPLLGLPERLGGFLRVFPEVRPGLFQVEFCELLLHLFGAKAARLLWLSASWPLRWAFPCCFPALRFHTFLSSFFLPGFFSPVTPV